MIEKEISANKVMIFSKSYCPFCNEAKAAFTDLNVEYKSIELDNIGNGDKIQSALLKLTGQKTVPNIFVKGFNLYLDEHVILLAAHASTFNYIR